MNAENIIQVERNIPDNVSQIVNLTASKILKQLPKIPKINFSHSASGRSQQTHGVVQADGIATRGYLV